MTNFSDFGSFILADLRITNSSLNASIGKIIVTKEITERSGWSDQDQEESSYVIADIHGQFATWC